MEWQMKPSDNATIISSASIDIQGQETRIEKILPAGAGQETLRLSTLAIGALISQPLILTEEELLDLLHHAIHARVLSQDFITKLRQKIEI
jgi:hypothetical protein